MPRTAVLSLEVLFRNSPKDKEIAIQFANALAEIGEVQTRRKNPLGAVPASPTDNDLAQALKDISARKTIDEGGYEALADGTGSYRDILKDKERGRLARATEPGGKDRRRHRTAHQRIRNTPQGRAQ